MDDRRTEGERSWLWIAENGAAILCQLDTCTLTRCLRPSRRHCAWLQDASAPLWCSDTWGRGLLPQPKANAARGRRSSAGAASASD